MFGDQKAVIPLMLLGPSCDLFNSSACVVAACGGLGKSKRIKLINMVTGRFAYKSFRLLSVRLRLSRFAYVQYVS